MDRLEIDRQDTALAVQAQKGDRDGYASLVERYQGRIFSYCYQFFRGDRELAAELTQETFLRAYRFIKRYDSKKKFSTWIYSIAKNICIDEHRKIDRGRTVSIEDLPPSVISATQSEERYKDPLKMTALMEDRMILEEAIAQLPEKYRTAIILCYFQELPYQEIADILGLSLNLVKVRIFRAKKRLLEILKGQSQVRVGGSSDDED